MQIFTVLQKGEYHFNNCEDYLYHGKIGSNKLVAAVMDGCTMGDDCYLASTLAGKILRKIVEKRGYEELQRKQNSSTDLDTELKSIVGELFSELRFLKNHLVLKDKELLTTLIISLIDLENTKGIILTVGDGVICVDGKITEYDHDNKPDYLGFHLSKDFDSWYKDQQQKIFIDNFSDISLCTDGITSFTKTLVKENKEEINPTDFLIADKKDPLTDDLLQRKLKKLENEWGLKPTDDLAVIRIIR